MVGEAQSVKVARFPIERRHTEHDVGLGLARHGHADHVRLRRVRGGQGLLDRIGSRRRPVAEHTLSRLDGLLDAEIAHHDQRGLVGSVPRGVKRLQVALADAGDRFAHPNRQTVVRVVGRIRHLAPGALDDDTGAVVHLGQVGERLATQALQLVGREGRATRDLGQDLGGSRAIAAQAFDGRRHERVADIDGQASAHAIQLFSQLRLADVLTALTQHAAGHARQPLVRCAFAAGAGADQGAHHN